MSDWCSPSPCVRHNVQPRGARATNTSLAALEHPSSPSGPFSRTGLRSVASETRFSTTGASGCKTLANTSPGLCFVNALAGAALCVNSSF